MDKKLFFNVVRKMRDSQKRYFKYKEAEDLKESKELERIVDEEIERVVGVLTPEQLLLPKELWEKFDDAIMDVMHRENPQPQEGVEALSTAYLNIIRAVGGALGYKNPSAFCIDLLNQMINQL